MTDMHKVLREAKRLTLQHPLFNAISIMWELRDFGLMGVMNTLVITCTMRVPDRNFYRAPVPTIPVFFRAQFTSEVFDRMRDDELQTRLAMMLKDTLAKLMFHEIDEMLQRDGVRIVDPHAGER